MSHVYFFIWISVIFKDPIIIIIFALAFQPTTSRLHSRWRTLSHGPFPGKLLLVFPGEAAVRNWGWERYMLQNERLGSSQVTSASQVTRTGVPACLETVAGPRSLFVLRGEIKLTCGGGQRLATNPQARQPRTNMR